MFRNSHKAALTLLTLVSLALQLPARAGVESEIQSSEEAIPVVYPGLPLGKVQPVIQAPVAVPTAVASSRPAPHDLDRLMVTNMNGQVHLKHLQGPRLEPSRALYLETGAGLSWCEFKLPGCTGRAWKETQVSVFPDANAVYLNKGALVLQARGADATKYTVMAGDYSLRLHAGVIRIQKTDSAQVQIQVLSGSLIVHNRKSGELMQAGPKGIVPLP
ncbi:MAG: hypothetical protein K2X27_04100 [Candidatus Obscuribacterales bacterium]|nr:hypothetical protein [Candidatus Obscuribacterales bacterium]